LVEEQCKSPEAALKITQAGLDKAYEIFEFVAPDGLSGIDSSRANEGSGKVGGFDIPHKGKTLKGAELKSRSEWTMVPSKPVPEKLPSDVSTIHSGASFRKRQSCNWNMRLRRPNPLTTPISSTRQRQNSSVQKWKP